LFWERYLPLFKQRPFQLCGIVSGGVPVVCALRDFAYQRGLTVNTFESKQAQKTYGLANWLEGVVLKDLSVLLVDDIVGPVRL
jgi:hypothetical protein